MDVVMLSRVQFGLTSAFHYIYPPLSIGIGLMLVIFEGFYVKTKNVLYQQIARFWTKIFALTFALGVATGLVQLFGFGTNWANYSRFVGDVFGSALGAEGIFAFFLEAGFLGVMLFGWERCTAKLHYFSTICVACGAHFSAIWIVVANSWMQTPAGHIVTGEGLQARATIMNFWEMVFNPSSMDRLTHVILGCWLSGIFCVLSVSSYYYLKKRYVLFTRATLRISLIAAAIVLVLQLISADSTARGVAKNQPSKLAAMEGIYVTEPKTPITVLGWVDNAAKTVRGFKIPGLLSFLVFHDFDTPVTGFDQIPEDERPPIQVVFQSYHMMIAMWALMALITALACIQYSRKKLIKSKWLLRGLVTSVIFPQIANFSGWMTAEVGRQPWIVYGILKTVDGISTNIHREQVFFSIIMFLIIYALLFALFIYLLNHKIQHGPEDILQVKQDVVYRNPFDTKKEV